MALSGGCHHAGRVLGLHRSIWALADALIASSGSRPRRPFYRPAVLVPINRYFAVAPTDCYFAGHPIFLPSLSAICAKTISPCFSEGKTRVCPTPDLRYRRRRHFFFSRVSRMPKGRSAVIRIQWTGQTTQSVDDGLWQAGEREKPRRIGEVRFAACLACAPGFRICCSRASTGTKPRLEDNVGRRHLREQFEPRYRDVAENGRPYGDESTAKS